MEQGSIFVGIDVSKKRLDVALRDPGRLDDGRSAGTAELGLLQPVVSRIRERPCIGVLHSTASLVSVGVALRVQVDEVHGLGVDAAEKGQVVADEKRAVTDVAPFDHLSPASPL